MMAPSVLLHTQRESATAGKKCWKKRSHVNSRLNAWKQLMVPMHSKDWIFAPSEKPLLKLACPCSTDRYLEYFSHRTWQWQPHYDSFCWIWSDSFIACFLNAASQESNPSLHGFNIQRPPLTLKSFCCKDPLSVGVSSSPKGCKREKGKTQKRK